MRCLVVLIVAGFLWGLSPLRAVATCGDWLAGGVAHQPVSVEEEMNRLPVHLDPIRPGVPCDGPLCHRDSEPESGGPPAPSAPTSVDQLAWLTNAPNAGVTPDRWRRVCSCPTRARLVPGRLDRPPEIL